jgi:hypothetical protein
MLTNFLNRSHITPALINGETFTDKEIAKIYDVSLTTISWIGTSCMYIHCH